MLTFEDRIELWVVEVDTAGATRLMAQPLSSAFSRATAWLPDSSGLLAAIVPDDRGPTPEEPTVPAGPVIEQNLGRKAPARTYQDLLENAHDEALFEHLATVQLVRVNLDGSVATIGSSGMISDFDPSPDGRFILVNSIRKPFSYKVPVSRFPLSVEIWNTDGDVVHTVAELPLADDVPVAFGSVRRGPRSVQWRQDADATVVWAEALDGGDAGAEAELRDQLFMLQEPFREDPTALLALDHRFAGTYWGTENLAIVMGWWWPTRNYKAWRLQPGKPDAEPTVIFEYSWEDRYDAPGWPVTKPTDRGTHVLQTADKGRKIFLIGDGASPEGDRPFLDEMDLGSGETSRLFRSEAPHYERPVMLMDPEDRVLMTRREAQDVQPNYWLRILGGGELTQLTHFPHPNPSVCRCSKGDDSLRPGGRGGTHRHSLSAVGL